MPVMIRLRTVVWLATALALGVVATMVVTQAWRADAAPGDVDSTFVPIANCRLFDSRPAPNNVGPKDTPLGPGSDNVYAQQVTGANGNCTIPADAVGVSMNVTIANPTAPSNLRIFPADVEVPLASSLNWLPGQSPTPNKVDVKLSPDGKIGLFNQAGTVDVLADVVGYYTASSLSELSRELAAAKDEIEAVKGAVAEGAAVRFAAVNADGTLRASSGVSSVAKTDTGVYEITFDRPVDDECAVAFGDFTTIGESVRLHSYGTPRGPDTITVFSYFTNGDFVDSEFDVTVVCPPSTP